MKHLACSVIAGADDVQQMDAQNPNDDCRRVSELFVRREERDTSGALLVPAVSESGSRALHFAGQKHGTPRISSEYN